MRYILGAKLRNVDDTDFLSTEGSIGILLENPKKESRLT